MQKSTTSTLSLADTTTAGTPAPGAGPTNAPSHPTATATPVSPTAAPDSVTAPDPIAAPDSAVAPDSATALGSADAAGPLTTDSLTAPKPVAAPDPTAAPDSITTLGSADAVEPYTADSVTAPKPAAAPESIAAPESVAALGSADATEPHIADSVATRKPVAALPSITAPDSATVLGSAEVTWVLSADSVSAPESVAGKEPGRGVESEREPEWRELESGGELDELDELTPAELARMLPRVGERRWSQRIPALYPVAVRYHRARRRIEWMRSSTAYAQAKQGEDLPVRVKRHKSLLLRQLGETEMWMQHNKVTNLKLACGQVDGVLIKPGETFSFNKLVGNATRRKGYVKGMRLSNGQAKPGIGGGICQLANLLHWMVLHSPLTVTQRSNHSFDPFPDNGRVLPWGVGCSIVYNYVDLQFRNDTDQTFQLRVGVGERYLEGEILAERSTSSSYRVFARGERFLRAGSEYFRRNEIWRTVIDRRTGSPVGDELIRENVALVKYMPSGVNVIDVDLHQYPPAS